MKQKKILLVEDDFLNRRLTKKMLLDKEYSIYESKSMDEAQAILEKENIDLAIIDINLGEEDKSGVTLGRYIKSQYAIPFIYLTAYDNDEVIKEAIATVPYSYLTKPFKRIDLTTSVEIALRNNVKSVTYTSVAVKDGEYNVELAVKEIDYIESDGNYLIFFADNKTYKSRSTIKEILEKLPNDIFLQTHRAFVVNKFKVEKYSLKSVVVKNKTIPISKTFANSIDMSLLAKK